MATALEQARWRARVARAGRCASCGRRRLDGLRRCAYCLARDLEKRLPEMVHDRACHAVMLMLSHCDGSACAASGLTGQELTAIGESLTVDRIDSGLGYALGNMQLLSRSLNRSKWRMASPPRWEIERLLRRHQGIEESDFD